MSSLKPAIQQGNGMRTGCLQHQLHHLETQLQKDRCLQSKQSLNKNSEEELADFSRTSRVQLILTTKKLDS